MVKYFKQTFAGREKRFERLKDAVFKILAGKYSLIELIKKPCFRLF